MLLTLSCAVLLQARRRRREACSKALQATFERLQLYAHGARLSTWDEATQQALQRHLVRGLGAEAVDQLLHYQQVRNLRNSPPAIRRRQRHLNAGLASNLWANASPVADRIHCEYVWRQARSLPGSPRQFSAATMAVRYSR